MVFAVVVAVIGAVVRGVVAFPFVPFLVRCYCGCCYVVFVVVVVGGGGGGCTGSWRQFRR